MIIDCISDLHGTVVGLEGGDLLIVAGDITALDEAEEYASYFQWLESQPYEKIVWIAGNHDGCIANRKVRIPKDGKIEYLQDSGTEYKGLKIWGSPWTPTFQDWHFMKDRGKAIQAVWDKIPLDTDILITHGPPFGILDQVAGPYNLMQNVGCQDLREKIEQLKQLKLHVFGHIHESHGVQGKFVNASIMNEDYDPVNLPVRIELPNLRWD